MKNLILRLLLNAFSILYFNFAFAIGLYIFLKNAEILAIPQILLNGDYNFVINFIFGIPETEKRYRCSLIIDAIGYGNGGINKIEE